MNWRSQAACAGLPLEVFFPETADERRQAEETARRWCAPCPVRAACREAADLYRDEGVRGAALGRSDKGAYRRDLLLPDVVLDVLPPRARRLGPDKRRRAA